MSDGRVVMISGAGRGIGAAIASALAQRGWRLSLGVRTPERVAGGAEALVHRYDAREPGSERVWVAATVGPLRPDRRRRQQCRDHDPEERGRGRRRRARRGPRCQREGTLAPCPGGLAAPGRERPGTGGHRRLALGQAGEVGGLGALCHEQVRGPGAWRTRSATRAGRRACARPPSALALSPPTWRAASPIVPPEAMTQPEDLARIVALILELPNTASVAEIPINALLDELLSARMVRLRWDRRSIRSLPTRPCRARVGVVIVGGGIIGTSAALFLAQRGVSVALCEKGQIAGEQSSRNWGWVRKMGRDPREIPLIIESLRLWEGMNEIGGGRDRLPPHRHPVRLRDRRGRGATRRTGSSTRGPTSSTRGCSRGAELARADARRRRPAQGRALHRSDGRAEPQKAAPAIARAARRAGAAILTNCAVRGVETRGRPGRGGRHREGPHRLRARGPGGRGLVAPVLRQSRPPPAAAQGPLHRCCARRRWRGRRRPRCGRRFAFRKRLDGGYNDRQRRSPRSTISCPTASASSTTSCRRCRWSGARCSFRLGGRFLAGVAGAEALDARPSPRPSSECGCSTRSPSSSFTRGRQGEPRRRCSRPSRNARVVQEWAGLIDVTPDVVPVISPVDSVPGLFIATGFSGHGFGIGPGAGRLVADLVTGSDPIVDPTPFRFSRFIDGSRPRPDRGHLRPADGTSAARDDDPRPSQRPERKPR